jgi:hypothetical protein
LQVNGADVLRFGADTSGQLAGSRNRLLNGNFQINQLAVSGTITLAAGQYGHDGFKAGASGCTYTFASSGGIVTLTITAGTLKQVANGKDLQSGSMVLGWNGTAQARIDSGSYGASPQSGTAVGGTNQTCEWGTGTLSLPQYEPGAIRTSFEFRDDELTRCQKYYQVKTVIINTSTTDITVTLNTSMNSVPTFSGGGAGFAIDNATVSEFSVYQTTRGIQTLLISARL